LTLRALDGLARSNNQHLPFDPPFRRSATLGGAIACNAVGPRSLMHGPIGHSITGASMVLANATLVKSGARTVKNVAGYDLHKLFIGSHGSLGLLARVSLRLKALPDDFRIVRLRTDSITEARSMIDLLTRGPTRPCLIEVLNSNAAADLGADIDSEHSLLFVGYEGAADEVAWQLDQINAAWKKRAVRLDRDDSRAQHEALASWPERESDYAFEVTARAPHRWKLIDSCGERGIAVKASGRSGPVLGCGMGDLTPETAAALRADAGPTGSVKFARIPAGSSVPRWLCAGPAFKWMRAIKQEFDPNRVFPWPGFLDTGCES
jgi:glycolate oxidase FAD binding subunit